ncbi:MAG: hypothetical protein R3C16_00660 [Hyphomonadaceae bacterium]
MPERFGRQHVVLADHEAVALMAGDDALGALLVGEQRHRFVDIAEFDRQPDRFAVATAARQLVRIEREGAAIAGEQQQLVGRPALHDVLGRYRLP